MDDDARTRIAEAVARGGDQDALHALRSSLEWSAQAVARLAGTPSGTGAVEAVFLLDDALTASSQLTGAVAELLAAAEPGPDAVAYLEDQQRELAEIRDKVLTCRQEHESLVKSEAELRRRLDELDALRGQVAELRRLARLVEALDEIRAQQDAVEERLALLRRHADGTEDALQLGSAELLRLTEDRLSRLAAPVREALERTSAAQRELAAAETELTDAERDAATATARLAQVRVERDERLAELSACARADRQLVEALADFTDPTRTKDADGALEQARTLIDAVETRVHDLEAVLGRALDTRDRAVGPGRALVAWNDEGPAPHPVK
ncbi:hypothetical protein [Streptomyces sp. NPDC001137]|uniref:hypothetical protein n=1 Tax=Streptomyces sp. NPDC001137 TaxID=3154378 RepID=UPI003328FB76